MKLLETKTLKDGFRTIFIGIDIDNIELNRIKNNFDEITERFYSANILIQSNFRNGLTTALLKLANEWTPFRKKIKIMDENFNEKEVIRLFDKIAFYIRWYDFKRSEIEKLLDPFILIVDDWSGEYEEKLWYVLDTREKSYLTTLIGTHAVKVDSVIYSKFDCIVKIANFEIKEIKLQWL